MQLFDSDIALQRRSLLQCDRAPPWDWQKGCLITVTSTTFLLLLSHSVQATGICTRTLEIQNAVIRNIPEVSHCSAVTNMHLEEITFLNLSNSEIAKLTPGDFAHMTGLVELDLRQNSLPKLTAGVFDGLSSLSRIHLGNNSIREIRGGVFSNLPRLRRLNLAGNGLLRIRSTAFSNAVNLTELDLRHNSLVSIPPGLFRNLPKLQVLGIDDSMLPKIHSQVFNRLKKVKLNNKIPKFSIPAPEEGPNADKDSSSDLTGGKSLGKITFNQYSTRVFASGQQYPPRNFAAYGVVAFRSGVTSTRRDRYIAICEGYVASILSSHEMGNQSLDTAEEMVTVWPLNSEVQAEEWNFAAAGSDCESIVGSIDMQTSSRMIRLAEQQTDRQLRGVGPFLLAWSPADSVYNKKARILMLDLSDVELPDQAVRMFNYWNEQIMEDPEIWDGTWNLERIRLKIMLAADKWGTNLLLWLG